MASAEAAGLAEAELLDEKGEDDSVEAVAGVDTEEVVFVSDIDDSLDFCCCFQAGTEDEVVVVAVVDVVVAAVAGFFHEGVVAAGLSSTTVDDRVWSPTSILYSVGVFQSRNSVKHDFFS